MAFVDLDKKTVRLIMTDYGKELLFKKGIYETFKSFSLSDEGLIYWLSVEPEYMLEITGSNKNATDITMSKDFKYSV